jgi:hypothetical protein
MFRSLTALSVIALGSVPVSAATYSAKLSVPTTQRIIARDISWSCGSDACQGATQESRPVVLCQGLAKRAGRVDTFLVDGRAFTPAELDKCNASAKAASDQKVAAK